MALNFGNRAAAAAANATPATAPASIVTPARMANAAAPDAIFTGIENARASVATNYFREGRYFSYIRGAKQFVTRKGERMLLVEHSILAVISGVNESHRPGEEVGHLLKVSQDSFLGNVKAMIAGITGCHVDEVKTAHCAECFPVEGNSPLAGSLVEVHARPIVTKAGKPFTVIDYKRPISATEVAEAMTDIKIANAILGVGVLEAAVAKEAAAQG